MKFLLFGILFMNFSLAETGSDDYPIVVDSCFEDCGRSCLEHPVFCGLW